MRATFIPIFAALIATAVLSVPASATTLSQATKLCQKNPNCNNIGGGTFCVDVGKDLCKHQVYCPDKGKCSVILLKAGGGDESLSAAMLERC